MVDAGYAGRGYISSTRVSFGARGGVTFQPTGGSILMFEPSGTSITGDRHEGEIPAHVDSTTGHDLTAGGR